MFQNISYFWSSTVVTFGCLIAQFKQLMSTRKMHGMFGSFPAFGSIQGWIHISIKPHKCLHEIGPRTPQSDIVLLLDRWNSKTRLSKQWLWTPQLVKKTHTLIKSRPRRKSHSLQWIELLSWTEWSARYCGIKCLENRTTLHSYSCLSLSVLHAKAVVGRATVKGAGPKAPVSAKTTETPFPMYLAPGSPIGQRWMSWLKNDNYWQWKTHLWCCHASHLLSVLFAFLCEISL